MTTHFVAGIRCIAMAVPQGPLAGLGFELATHQSAAVVVQSADGRVVDLNKAAAVFRSVACAAVWRLGLARVVCGAAMLMVSTISF